jgi:hypothetical protein
MIRFILTKSAGFMMLSALGVFQKSHAASYSFNRHADTSFMGSFYFSYASILSSQSDRVCTTDLAAEPLRLDYKTRNFRDLKAVKSTAMLNEAVSGNPKGMYAGIFFGYSNLQFSYGKDPISLTEIGFSRITDSVVALPKDIKATIDPASESSSINLDAGFYLGYFPGLLTFNLAENQVLAFGAMTKLGLSFRNGFGAWLGVGPEVAYRKDAWSVNAGYLFSYVSMDRKLGKLKLEGTDFIVIEDAYRFGSNPQWESESSQWRRHDVNSELVASGSAISQSPYIRLGYNWGGDDKSGIGLVIGYRMAQNNDVKYELHGQHKKIAEEHKSPLRGAEFQNLGNALNFSGLYVQLELFTVPF